MNVPNKIPTPIPRLPLWRLEMMREQAERKFRRTEEEHLAASRELEQIRNLIAERREETPHG